VITREPAGIKRLEKCIRVCSRDRGKRRAGAIFAESTITKSKKGYAGSFQAAELKDKILINIMPPPGFEPRSSDVFDH